MNDWSKPTRVPIEVIFSGCHPNQKTVEDCLEAARSAGLHSRRVDSCAVLIQERSRETEIRIDVRAVEGEVFVDRFASTPSEEMLRVALRDAFARVERRIDQVRSLHVADADVLDSPIEPAEPPPCVWQG